MKYQKFLIKNLGKLMMQKLKEAATQTLNHKNLKAQQSQSIEGKVF